MTAPIPINLDAIRAREAAATPGPWRHDPNSAWRVDSSAHEYVYAARPIDGHGVVALTGIKGDHVRNPHDAEFIAHARTDIPALIAEVERLRERERDLLEQAGYAHHMFTALESELEALRKGQ